MATPFIAQIHMFSFNFAPRLWAVCNGQLLPINQNQALFSLLGTTYGGNGTTNFALPDLRSRVPVHPSNAIFQGQTGGAEAHALTMAEMPSHTHTGMGGAPACSAAAGTNNTPVARFAGVTTRPRYADAANGSLGGGTSGATGGGQSHTNIQPYLVVNYCIALSGIFPSRN